MTILKKIRPVVELNTKEVAESVKTDAKIETIRTDEQEPDESLKGEQETNALTADTQEQPSFKYPTKTLSVPIGAYTPRNGETIADCRVEIQIIGDKTKPIIIVNPALTGGAKMYLPGESTQGWGWGNNMIGPGKTFDPDKYCIVCCSHIGGAEGSTGPRNLGQGFPAISIYDIAKASAIALQRLGKTKDPGENGTYLPFLKNRGIEAITGISFGGYVSIALTDALLNNGIKVKKLIPIESTHESNAFILATGTIYESLCETIPNILNRKCGIDDKLKETSDGLNNENIKEIIKIISNTGDKIFRLMSVLPADLSHKYRNKPENGIKFINGEIIPDIACDYLEKKGHENYREAVMHVREQLWKLGASLENKTSREIQEALLSVIRQFGFLLFWGPEKYRKDPNLVSFKKNKTKNLRTKLLYEGQKFVERFSLRAMAVLALARDKYKTTAQMIQNINNHGVEVTFIGNNNDQLYDKASVMNSAVVMRANYKSFSNDTGHDGAFEPGEHIKGTPGKITLCDRFHEVL